MDETLETEGAALFTIRERGYLNDFETITGAWYEVGRAPMETDELGYGVTASVAEKLIKEGKVIEVSRGHPPGDSHTRVVCYRAA